MDIKIIKLLDVNNDIFNKVCEWHYNWWGKRDNYSKEEVICYLEHSLCKNRIPQTFVALIDSIPVGTYQLSMSDDLDHRPDIYPWLANVYVDEQYRGKGICRELMNSVQKNANQINIKELFLYTKHFGLYEKFGWEYVEEINLFKRKSNKNYFHNFYYSFLKPSSVSSYCIRHL